MRDAGDSERVGRMKWGLRYGMVMWCQRDVRVSCLCMRSRGLSIRRCRSPVCEQAMGKESLRRRWGVELKTWEEMKAITRSTRICGLGLEMAETVSGMIWGPDDNMV